MENALAIINDLHALMNSLPQIFFARLRGIPNVALGNSRPVCLLWRPYTSRWVLTVGTRYKILPVLGIPLCFQSPLSSVHLPIFFQVMPFVLRRTKAQVLHDLPPKIIQDIYCNMSPLQVCRLSYESIASSLGGWR